ncbi:MAG: hypothetical protein AB7E51_12670 [Pseudodesulfovibrio sp.]|uniref:hypothetical protein n=1 Tax=Pseudodesulfovibrio sp. TaxID=2035812 RepID=UPI003D09D350
MRKALFLALTAVLLILASAPGARAQGETLYSEYTYVMGERDSMLDGKKISFVEAKRLLTEKAGTYLESTTQVSEGVLTQDEIQTYAMASLRVEIVEQCVKPRGEQMTAYTKVKGDVDASNMPRDVAAIKNNQELKEDLDRQKVELENTHSQVEELNEKIRKLEERKAPDQEIRRTVARREAALDGNITQGMAMFCSLACSTARLRDTQFVQTMFQNAGMAPMLSMLMGPEECSALCIEVQRSLVGSLLAQ